MIYRKLKPSEYSIHRVKALEEIEQQERLKC
jgi:hypothetical protein